MDILLTIFYCVLLLSILVFIHEGGHFVTAKMFGVRVTEFMIGLPGPSIGFKFKGTKFGITPILLGGYARVCGMEPGNLKPYVPEVLQYIHSKGSARISEVSRALVISSDSAEDALDELVQWGSLAKPTSKELSEDDTRYYAEETEIYKKGEARPVENKWEYFKNEYFCQYRSLPFWKRCIILLAGIIVNLLFAMAIFVILYTLIGFDVQNKETLEIRHITMNPLEAIQYGAKYIAAVAQAIVSLFNPATAAETVSHSTSLIGIAVISKSAAEQGICAFLEFMAMISVSLGLMNLLPIPPLDGGKFVIEIYQKITGKNVSERTVNILSIVGILFFVGLLLIMLNQDINRFIFHT